MNDNKISRIYYLDDTEALSKKLKTVKRFEFALLLYLYKNSGYETAKRYLDGLKEFYTERKDPNYVKPKPTNQNYKHGNWTSKKRKQKIEQKILELSGLQNLDSSQQQTALNMLKDHGVAISQNYINSCLKNSV